MSNTGNLCTWISVMSAALHKICHLLYGGVLPPYHCFLHTG